MSNARVRLPEDWLRFDKIGLFGSLVFPAALMLLWLTGFGPSAYQACSGATSEISLLSDGGKVTLSGRVADLTDRTLVDDAARQTYGAGNVVDKLKVDDGVQRITWQPNAAGLFKRLKAIGPTASMKITGGDAVVEGTVADKATKDATARELSNLLGTKVTLKDGLVIAAAPAKKEPEPVAAPPPPVAVTPPPAAPVQAEIATGKLGRYRLPNGTEIEIVGSGLESKVLAFLKDGSKAVDKGLWFDFDRLHFKTGSANLTEESKAQIDTVVEILKAYPTAAIKIGGYTDNVGDPDANLKLSAARAERVAEQFVGLGIAAGRIEAEGYGEQHPIASNDTAEGRALNRRTALSVRHK